MLDGGEGSDNNAVLYLNMTPRVFPITEFAQIRCKNLHI